MREVPATLGEQHWDPARGTPHGLGWGSERGSAWRHERRRRVAGAGAASVTPGSQARSGSARPGAARRARIRAAWRWTVSGLGWGGARPHDRQAARRPALTLALDLFFRGGRRKGRRRKAAMEFWRSGLLGRVLVCGLVGWAVRGESWGCVFFLFLFFFLFSFGNSSLSLSFFKEKLKNKIQKYTSPHTHYIYIYS